MTADRLRFALTSGLSLPDTGEICLIGAAGDADLSALPADRLRIVQPVRPDHDALAARGFAVGTDMPERAAAAIVVLPRARDRAESWIAAAAGMVGDGPVVVDGAKTDGAEAMLRAVAARTTLDGQVSKAHGKVFWFSGAADFSDWAHGPRRIGDGVLTAPGVFSADAPDPASIALLAALPARPGARIADLGAGWGHLSAALLDRTGVETVHMVEADRLALDCAEANVTDPRAVSHWADATRWKAPEPLDAVVMNPPFHAGRRPDPALGRAFIANAARLLKPAGRLWLVANRHLPYEAALESQFREVAEIGGDTKFKILAAARPAPPKR